MNFLSGLSKSAQPSSDEPSSADHPEKPASNTDLLASAKVMAEAAQAGDKTKAAGAAADLLDAAGKYGKLDETKGAGKYVEQAEDYLRQYGNPASGDHKAPAATGEGITAPKTTTDAEKPSGGGAGDYLKKAEEYLSKPSGEGGEKKETSSESGGGYGDLMKAAGGFLNK